MDDRNIELSKKESGEDATKYGEFVCSEYHWVTPQEQRRNTKHLENITKNKENDRKS